MDFFYNLNKKLAEMAAPEQTINEGKQVAEKIEPPIKTNPAERGKYAGKGVGDLKKQMSRVKDQMAGYKERGEKVPAELRGKFSELTFAIRAKQAHGGKWSSIKETDQEDLKPYEYTMKEEDMDEMYILEKDMEEGNEFSGELAKARASGAKSFKVDGKEYPVKEGKAKPDFLDLDKDGNKKESMKKAAKDAKKSKSAGTAFDPDTAKKMFAPEKGKTKTGHEVKDTGYSKRYTKQLSDEPETDDSDDGATKKKGRKAVGAGKGKKIGAKAHGTSKLHRKDAIAEMDNEDMIALVDKGEYDREGDMAKEQLHTINAAAKELASILSDDENLPEWVQSKITKAMDYIDTARDYMKSTKADRDDEMVPERKLTKGEMSKREKFVKGMKKAKGDFEKRYGDRGEEVMYATATKMAKGAKKDESMKETDAPKKTGGIQFGKGVYEAMNDQVEQLITEGMNISVNMSTDADGKPTKNITVSAEGHDAEALAKLLNLAGLHGHAEQVDEVDDNNPDYPTDQETIGNDDPHLERYAGGLNKPKSTGQTTGAPFNRQLARQGAGKMAEGADLGMSLYKELQQYKGK